MVVRPVIDAPEMREVLRKLQKVDPDARKHLQKEFRTSLSSDAVGIAAAVPKVAPLSGMANDGRLRWPRSVKGSVRNFSGRVKGMAKDESPLVSIWVTSGVTDAGFKMAELAGVRKRYTGGYTDYYVTSAGIRRRHLRTSQGRAMVEELNKRYPIKGTGGRFAYDRAYKERGVYTDKALGVLNGFFDKFNRDMGA